MRWDSLLISRLNWLDDFWTVLHGLDGKVLLMIEFQNNNCTFILLTQWFLSSFCWSCCYICRPFFYSWLGTGWAQVGFCTRMASYTGARMPIEFQKSWQSRPVCSTRLVLQQACCRGFGENFSWNPFSYWSYWGLPHFDFNMQCGQWRGQSVAA